MELISRPFSEEDKTRLIGFFEKIKDLYPDVKSCVMPCLYAGQELVGFISKEVVEEVARLTGLSEAHVIELASFYTMFHLRPVGRYHIQICRTASCYFFGGKQLITFLKDYLGVDEGEVTADGMFSWELVECLGSCGTAPAVAINDRLFEFVSKDDLKNILDEIKIKLPNLNYSVFSNSFSEDFKKYPFSRILSNG